MLKETRTVFASDCEFVDQQEGHTLIKEGYAKDAKTQVFSSQEMENNTILLQTKALQKREFQNYLLFALYSISILGLAGLTLHGHSEYLKFFHKNKYLQQEALPVYEFCNKGYPGYSTPPPSSLNCHLYAKHATMNLHIESLENTILHLLDDLNIFRMISCSQSETCRFVAFYAATTVFASFNSVVLFICMLLALSVYFYIKGPLASKRAVKKQVFKQKERDISKEISNDMKEVWKKISA